MTTEERIHQLIGAQVVTICNLQTALEQAQAKIRELEQNKQGENKESK